MNILIGNFQLESNEHVPTINTLNDFLCYDGDEITKHMHVDDLALKYDVNIIPAIFYEIFAGSVLERKSFDYILNKLIVKIKENLDSIDGIYLFLHGASKVVDLPEGSGEHYLMKEIRKVTGNDLPIAVVMDPHGNISKEYVESINILRCFRQSPHTDNIETRRLVFELFINYLKKGEKVNALYKKLPLILGGETSVSTDEPMISINKYLNEMEKDERIKSCSFHIGYIRHDSKFAGTGLVVVPENECYRDYANEILEKLSKFILDRKRKFHYTGRTLSKEEAIIDALNFDGKPYVITDSGDNVTSGSTGYNTYVLRQFLKSDIKNKKVLFAAITDPIVLEKLNEKEIGTKLNIDLGMNIDELSQKVNLDVVIFTKGKVEPIGMPNKIIGKSVTVKIVDKEIYITIIKTNTSFAEMHQYTASNLNVNDYDIIVVKQGYIFPELKAISKESCMSLTDGATYQDVKSIKFELIERPMFPIDDF